MSSGSIGSRQMWQIRLPCLSTRVLFALCLALMLALLEGERDLGWAAHLPLVPAVGEPQMVQARSIRTLARQAPRTGVSRCGADW